MTWGKAFRFWPHGGYKNIKCLCFLLISLFSLPNYGWMNKIENAMVLFSLKKVTSRDSDKKKHMKLFHRCQLNISGCSVRARKSRGRQSWCTKRWRTWTGRTSPPNPSSSTWWIWMTTLGGTVTHFFWWHFNIRLFFLLPLGQYGWQSQQREFWGIFCPFSINVVQCLTVLLRQHGNLSNWSTFSSLYTHCYCVLFEWFAKSREGGKLKVWIHRGVAILVTWVLSHSIYRGALFFKLGEFLTNSFCNLSHPFDANDLIDYDNRYIQKLWQ